MAIEVQPKTEPKKTAAKEPEIYTAKTPIQFVMCAYKLAKGLAWDDRDWDKHNFNRHARAGKSLLNAFEGNDKEAAEWLVTYGDRMKAAGLNWKLATAASEAWDTRGERKK